MTTEGGPRLCRGCLPNDRCRYGIAHERLTDGVLTVGLRCPAHYEAGQGIAHGGWTAGVMDEILGHVPGHHGQFAVTGQLEIDFLRPVPLERDLLGRAWVERRDGRRWYVAGVLAMAAERPGDQTELARARSVLVARDQDHYRRHATWLADWDTARRT
ncbi:PaaI family thioesterase [Parafrankia elaeagni]|uniref:PaaI family thioesterase n=1 Tax=Parafrankia elaeagni TaxID=222534 RepID=UPI0007C7F9E1|nr:PaaI family thioesterase [Parafrankia elaeagni]